MSDNIKLLISAGLNKDNTLRNINEGLQALSKHPSLQKLKIEMIMTDSFTRTAYKCLDIIEQINETMSLGTAELSNQLRSIRELKSNMGELISLRSRNEEVKDKTPSSGASFINLASKDIEGTIRSAATDKNNIKLLSEAVADAGLRFQSLEWFSRLYTSSAISARVATIGLQTAMSMGLSLAITGVTWAISQMVEALAKSRKEAAEAVKVNYAQLDSLNEQKKTINELRTEMESLLQQQDTGDLNLTGKQRLLEIQTQLVEQYGVAANKVDEEGRAYTNSLASIEARTKALEQEIKAEEELNRAKLLAQDRKNTKNIKNDQDDITDYSARIQNTKNQIAKLQEDIDSGIFSGDTTLELRDVFSKYGNLSRSDRIWGQKTLIKDTYTSQELLEAYNKELVELEAKYSEASESLQDNLQDRTRSLQATSKQYIDSLAEQKVQISDSLRLFIHEIVNSLAGNGEVLETQEKQIEDIINGLSSSNIEGLITSYHNLIDQFKLNPTRTDNSKIVSIRQQVEDLIATLTENKVSTSSDFMKVILAQFPDVEAKTFSLKNALEQISSVYDKSSEKISIYNELLNDNSSEKGLNAEKVAKLIQKDQSLIDLFKIENGIITLNTELTENQKKKEIDAIYAVTKEKKNELIASNQILSQKLKGYGVELTAINSLEDAIAAKDKISSSIKDVDGTGVESNHFYAANKDVLEGMDLLDIIIDLYKNAEVLNESLEKIGEGIKDDLTNPAKEAGEQLTELEKRLMRIDEALTRSINRRERYAKSSQKYRDALLYENKLLEEKKKLIEQDLSGKPLSPSNGNLPISSSTSTDSVSKMLTEAKGLVGKFKYDQIPGEFKGTYKQFVEGATSDCSQFVQEMFKEFLNVKLPRTSSEQAKVGTSVNKYELQSGDLVFFNNGTKSKDVSHVGISLGGTKFIQMGTKNGLSESDLTNSYWAPRYLSARRVAGDSIPTLSNSSDETSKRRDWFDADNTIYNNNLLYIDSTNASFEKKLAEQDGLIKKSQARQAKYTEDSQKYRNEESKQIDILLKKREIIHEQADAIRQSMKEYNIESDELNGQIRGLGESYDELTQEIQNKRSGIVNSGLEEFKTRISEIGYQLELSKAKMQEYAEGSPEFTKELQNQVALTKEQIKINKEAIAYIEEQLKNEQLSVKVKNDLKNELNELILSNYEYSQSIKEMNESYADSLISNYKKMLEKKRDLELASIEKSKKLEDERHKEAMDHLDEELKKFEEVINNQLKLLDRQSSSEDFDKALNKKLEERQKIVNQINTLALDDSYEAKARRLELEQQLKDKNEEINEFRLDREKELRKQNLSDQLDAKKEQIAAERELEGNYHDDIIKGWNQEKEKKEQLYQAMLEDEEFFYKLKQDLLSNDAVLIQKRINEVKEEYGIFFSFLQEQMDKVGTDAEILGEKLLNNLIYTFTQDAKNLDNSPNAKGHSTIEDTPEARNAWDSYLSNKEQAEKIRRQMATEKNKDSAKYKDLEKDFQFYYFQNEIYREKYGFPNKSYNELVNFDPFSAESGGITPSFAKGRFLLAHEKELILNKTDTANLLTVVDMTRSLISSVKNVTSNLLRPSSPLAASTGGDVNMYISIDKLQGNEEGANTFFNIIQKNIKKTGL